MRGATPRPAGRSDPAAPSVPAAVAGPSGLAGRTLVCGLGAVVVSIALAAGSAWPAAAEPPVRAAALEPAAAAAIARGDAAWERRSQGHRGERAQPEPIAEAVAAYTAAIAAHPDALEPYWKSLRALWFQGDFAARDDAERRAVSERARALAERALDAAAARLSADGAGARAALEALEPEALREALAPGDVADVARIHFWAAINWGTWARAHGLFATVREGVASHLRRYTRVAVALEPEYDGGGPLRLLSQLHAQLPRVPLVTGWVDRERALPLAERALAVSPDDPGNRFLLAITILDLGVAPERRDEALAILGEVATLEPRPDMLVEDVAMRESARDKLRELGETQLLPRPARGPAPERPADAG